ncbi:MAG TPA: hypothetical protein VH351_14605 [Bryobacteraceae bacterium]|jgi:hypothetical protein|nr:hypothetical protein [Bryobacteraceae bacterium]
MFALIFYGTKFVAGHANTMAGLNASSEWLHGSRERPALIEESGPLPEAMVPVSKIGELQ